MDNVLGLSAIGILSAVAIIVFVSEVVPELKDSKKIKRLNKLLNDDFSDIVPEAKEKTASENIK